MPEPDPFGVEIEEREDGTVAATYHVWGCGNVRHRKARAVALIRNIKRDGWRCAWCDAPIPEFRRADARYCREGCRKAAARSRSNPEACED